MRVPQVSWSTDEYDYENSIDVDLETQTEFVVCPACGHTCNIWEAMMQCLAQEGMTEFEQVTRHVIHGCGEPNPVVFWFWFYSEPELTAS